MCLTPRPPLLSNHASARRFSSGETIESWYCFQSWLMPALDLSMVVKWMSSGWSCSFAQSKPGLCCSAWRIWLRLVSISSRTCTKMFSASVSRSETSLNSSRVWAVLYRPSAPTVATSSIMSPSTAMMSFLILMFPSMSFLPVDSVGSVGQAAKERAHALADVVRVVELDIGHVAEVTQVLEQRGLDRGLLPH